MPGHSRIIIAKNVLANSVALLPGTASTMAPRRSASSFCTFGLSNVQTVPLKVNIRLLDRMDL